MGLTYCCTSAKLSYIIWIRERQAPYDHIEGYVEYQRYVVSHAGFLLRMIARYTGDHLFKLFGVRDVVEIVIPLHLG